MNVMTQSHESCADSIINTIPVFSYNLAEDTVGLGTLLITRQIEKSKEEFDALRQRVWQAIQNRLTFNNNGSWGNHMGKRNRNESFRRDYN